MKLLSSRILLSFVETVKCRVSPKVKMHGLVSWLCCFITVWPWLASSTSLCLNFLFKMCIIMRGLQWGLHEIIYVECLEPEDARTNFSNWHLGNINTPIMEFANFSHVNSPTLANFKSPVWHHCTRRWGHVPIGCWEKDERQLQHTTAWTVTEHSKHSRKIHY